MTNNKDEKEQILLLIDMHLWDWQGKMLSNYT